MNFNNQTVDILQKENWEEVNRNYIVKAIAELMHELVFQPTEVSRSGKDVTFLLETDFPSIQYQFTGQHRKMDFWHIDRKSLVKIENGIKTKAIDAPQFFIENREKIGVAPLTLSHFVEETYKTLYADAFLLRKGRVASKELIERGGQAIEQHMDGHPWATVNKGRIGFNLDDYHQYAPETSQKTKLFWIAVHESNASFHGIEGLTFEKVIQSELDQETLKEFYQILSNNKVKKEEYLFLPIHEWQWKNKLSFYYAADIANQKLIPLTYGKDHYSPQQSIRTFYNLDSPSRYYVKTAISILNTSIYRGLSPKKLRVAPFISQWIKEYIGKDQLLNSYDFVMLGEIATITHEHPHFGKIKDAPYHFHEMLGVIWRESAHTYLKEGESMMTMAALMYVDKEGKSILGELILKSGLSADEWIEQYLDVYLTPLLHCFYHYGLCFSPHGENTILVMKDNIPQRIIIKDFVEEIKLNEKVHAKAPKEVQNVVHLIEDKYVSLFLLSGIFDGVFRYISNVATSYVAYDEDKFWSIVRKLIINYQEAYPELSEEYQRFDLLAPDFVRVCINRVRLLTYGYKEDVDIPVPELCGILENPVFKDLD